MGNFNQEIDRALGSIEELDTWPVFQLRKTFLQLRSRWISSAGAVGVEVVESYEDLVRPLLERLEGDVLVPFAVVEEAAELQNKVMKLRTPVSRSSQTL